MQVFITYSLTLCSYMYIPVYFCCVTYIYVQISSYFKQALNQSKVLVSGLNNQKKSCSYTNTAPSLYSNWRHFCIAIVNVIVSKTMCPLEKFLFFFPIIDKKKYTHITWIKIKTRIAPRFLFIIYYFDMDVYLFNHRINLINLPKPSIR